MRFFPNVVKNRKPLKWKFIYLSILPLLLINLSSPPFFQSLQNYYSIVSNIYFLVSFFSIYSEYILYSSIYNWPNSLCFVICIIMYVVNEMCVEN